MQAGRSRQRPGRQTGDDDNNNCPGIVVFYIGLVSDTTQGQTAFMFARRNLIFADAQTE